jgi:uncharacterized protein YutE (UPF0331/DUF86 family)
MHMDLAVVNNRLSTIETNLHRLETLRALSFDDFVADFRNVEAAKHLLQVAIEAMIDVAGHFVARLRLKVPDHSAQLFMELADAHLMPVERATRYGQMARF